MILRRKKPSISPEEIRGALLLLMSIDENIERIGREVVEDNGEEEERG